METSSLLRFVKVQRPKKFPQGRFVTHVIEGLHSSSHCHILDEVPVYKRKRIDANQSHDELDSRAQVRNQSRARQKSFSCGAIRCATSTGSVDSHVTNRSTFCPLGVSREMLAFGSGVLHRGPPIRFMPTVLDTQGRLAR